jgi:hypothetical protein
MDVMQHKNRKVPSLLELLGLAVAIHCGSFAVAGEPAGYSPHADRQFPDQLLWGDTHVHTSLSVDARAFGAILTPEHAYRLARGDTVTASHGERVKLSRPLDWLVVADHSDALGMMDEIIGGNRHLMADPKTAGLAPADRSGWPARLRGHDGIDRGCGQRGRATGHGGRHDFRCRLARLCSHGRQVQ